MYILVYMYTYNRVTSICIDLSKLKLFVSDVGVEEEVQVLKVGVLKVEVKMGMEVPYCK